MLIAESAHRYRQDKLVENDTDILSDILDDFITSILPKIYDEIEVAIKVGDTKTVGSNAHKLAGSVVVYEYTKFGELARILEKEAKGLARESVMVSLFSEMKKIVSVENSSGSIQ